MAELLFPCTAEVVVCKCCRWMCRLCCCSLSSCCLTTPQGYRDTATLVCRRQPADVCNDLSSVACTRLSSAEGSSSSSSSHILSHSVSLPSPALPASFTCLAPSPSHALLRCICLHRSDAAASGNQVREANTSRDTSNQLYLLPRQP